MEGGCQPIDGTYAGWASSNVAVVSRSSWNSSIDIAWKIIPVSLVISIVCAIVAVAAPARTGEKSRVAGLVVLILVVAFAIYVVLMVMNLRIS